MHLSIFGAVNLSKTSSDSKWPAIAVNSAGEIMVVWTEWSSGQIYYKLNKGGQWSSMKNAGIDNAQAWSNQIDVDSYGTFHVTYADGRASSSRDIYYSYFTGSSWALAERIYYSPNNSAWNKMDIDTNNNIHVIWYHNHVPKGEKISSDVVTMSKARMGNWPQNYVNISVSKNIESIHPAIAVLKGNVYASWMEDAFPRRLYFREKTGGKWKTPVEIEKKGYYPDMDVDSSGNVHIVYSGKSGNFYYISRINGKWGTKQVISNGNAPLQFGDIKYKNNVLVAAWIQGSNVNWSLYAATRTSDGQWMLPVKIADASGGSEGNKHVQVALDNNNCAHFVWEGIGAGKKNDIFYAKYCFGDSEATFIEVEKSYLSFTTDESKNPDPQNFHIRAAGEKTLDYTISKDKSWLFVYPQQGTSSGEWDTITVEVESSSLNEGTYSGTITITSPEAYNSPIEIAVSLTVGEQPGPSYIEVDKNLLEFSMEEGINPDSQTFEIRASGGEEINYTISSNKEWLLVSPLQGTSSGEWDTITVKVNASDFKSGTRNGKITIIAPKANNSPLYISVSLTVREHYIEVNKNLLEFSMEEEKNPKPKIFKLRASGDEEINYTISSNKEWLLVSPLQGTSSGEWDDITVAVYASDFKPGTRQGKITIKAPKANNSPLYISVFLTIEEKKVPLIKINRSLLYFWAFAKGDNPASKTFKIKNDGKEILNYEFEANKDWIKVSPKKGTSKGEWDIIVASADISSLGVKTYKGEIKIKAPGAENSPQWIYVELEIKLPPYPYSPTNVQISKINHEGLMIKEYKSKIDWERNPKNKGLFTIKKHRIYRREKSKPDSIYVYLDEVEGNIFTYYDGGFLTKEERNKYTYAVTCVDTAGRESKKEGASGTVEISPSLSSEKKDLKRKNSPSDRKKI